MEDILNKEPVKRVQKKLNEFSNELNAIVLNSSARTAQQAAESLNTEVGSIVKSLLFKTEDSFENTVSNCDVLILGTDHDEFLDMDYNKLKTLKAFFFYLFC